MSGDTSQPRRDAERVESFVTAWTTLDRGWQATLLGLAIVAARALLQVA